MVCVLRNFAYAHIRHVNPNDVDIFDYC